MSTVVFDARIEAAVAVSPGWDRRPELVEVGRLLAGAGIALAVADDLDAALLRLAEQECHAQCVLLDAGSAAEAAEPRRAEELAGHLRRLRRERPDVAPVVLVAGAPGALVAAAFRAGAADVVDVSRADDLAVLTALERAAVDHFGRQQRRARNVELRKLIEDFLRMLVKAERRSLELEDALQPPAEDVERPPQVLVVDDEAGVVSLLEEVLARAGLTTVSCYTGEEAIEAIEKAERRHDPIDMALVDKNLPGIDGIETIRQLRARHAGLPCMVMTGFSSKDSAMRAADLGVVGYVLKPFDDVRELASRVRELAAHFAAERRERRFLGRIKQKHAQFLDRYKRLVGELERLGDDN